VAAGACVAAGAAAPQAETKSNRNRIPEIRALRLVNIILLLFVKLFEYELK
jgi:hypothetical protein